MSLLPIITMGLSSILLQIAALRQLLSVFSGNELDIGITLSVWLLSLGMGSYVGWRVRHEKGFAASFLAVALLSQLTVIFINAIRPVFSLGMGEAVSLTATIVFTALSLLPLCLALGIQFPLAVSYLKGASAKAYGIEALAAFIGGALFTLIISGRMNTFALITAVSSMNIFTAFYLSGKKPLIFLIIIPLLVHYGVSKFEPFTQQKGMAVVKRVDSKYGENSVLKTMGQSNVYLSGKLEFSYPDPQTEELRAHLPMSVHPSPRKLLVVSGSPAVLREYLKYDVDKVDFVEIDPVMVNISLDLLNPEDREILKDKRLRIITEDARRYLKSLKVLEYDLIILNLPEPSTANINRFYTVEFFREAKSVLNNGGAIFMTLPTASGYIGRRMQLANGAIYNSLKRVFNHAEVSSEEYGCITASDNRIDTNPQTLEQRFLDRSIKTGYFQPYILRDAFSPLKVALVKERLGRVDAVNSDARPLAYLYNLMLWSEIHGGALLSLLLEMREWQIAAIAAIAVIVALSFYWKKTEAVYYSIFTTGYAGMAFSLIIILSYQAAYGYIYEIFGLLTATFMLGIAAGAHIGKGVKRPLARVRLYEAAMAVLFILAPLFFKSEPLYYLLSLFCGFLAGGEFATANLITIPSPPWEEARPEGHPLLQQAQDERHRRSQRDGNNGKIAGKLYGIDLAGSFLGAMLTAVSFVPLLGVQSTIYFVALLKMSSLLVLATIKIRDP